MWNPLSAMIAAVSRVAVRADHEANEIGHDDAPIVIDDAGWCSGDRLAIRKSPRSNALATKTPIGICWHWTATGPGTSWTIAKSWESLPKPGQHVGSAHFIIGRSGMIIQTVSCLRGSWHAGYGRRWRKQPGGKYEPTVSASPEPSNSVSANRVLVGVELECVGELRPVRKEGGRWVSSPIDDERTVMMGWPFGDGRPGPIVAARDVVRAKDRHGRERHYHCYTEAQGHAIRRLLRALVDEYQIDRKDAAWGHIDIDPDRKSDPGPVFDWVVKGILRDVFGDDERATIIDPKKPAWPPHT